MSYWPVTQLGRFTSPGPQVLVLQGALKPSQVREVRVAVMQIMSKLKVAFTTVLQLQKTQFVSSHSLPRGLSTVCV